MKSVVVDGGDAKFQHLKVPQHRADIVQPGGGRGIAERRHLIKHEYLQREIVQGAFHKITGRMDMTVDQPRHGKFSRSIDDP